MLSQRAEPAKASRTTRRAERFERVGYCWYTAMAHNNIGSVHLAEQRMSKARTEFQAAFAGFVVEQDTAWQANTANNLANIFRAEGCRQRGCILPRFTTTWSALAIRTRGLGPLQPRQHLLGPEGARQRWPFPRGAPP